jgi:hypothetical protein
MEKGKRGKGEWGNRGIGEGGNGKKIPCMERKVACSSVVWTKNGLRGNREARGSRGKGCTAK